MKCEKYQYRKPRRQLHPLYEQTLKNHLHNLTQRKLSAVRDIHEQLPDPEALDPDFIDDAFGDLKPAARELLFLRLRPIEDALGWQLVPRAAEQMTAKSSQTYPPYFEEVLTAVVTNLRATREKQNQSLLSYKNLKRTIANYLGVKLKSVGNTLMKYITRQLIERGIISDWDEDEGIQSTAKIYRVNPDKLEV